MKQANNFEEFINNLNEQEFSEFLERIEYDKYIDIGTPLDIDTIIPTSRFLSKGNIISTTYIKSISTIPYIKPKTNQMVAELNEKNYVLAA